ncbi:hypothetical protein [Lichenihabitans psoromatis]|uniref:hypothetical protein n=1 Tax=Lichenihabitans psoromatis TaxID=2528642 RepID=UPI001038496E|nr:hypothetical protein [Lichenihabitans psoromatis]
MPAKPKTTSKLKAHVVSEGAASAASREMRSPTLQRLPSPKLKLQPARFNRNGKINRDKKPDRIGKLADRPAAQSTAALCTVLDQPIAVASIISVSVQADRAEEQARISDVLRNANQQISAQEPRAMSTQEPRAMQEGLFDLIRECPVAGASLCQEQVAEDTAGFNRCRRLRIAEAYLVSSLLKANFQLWSQFMQHEYFVGCKVKTFSKDDFAGHVTAAVMQFVFNPTGKSEAKSNRAWKMARAVQAYEDSDVPAEQVASQIERDGGIERLCRKAARETPLRQVQMLRIKSDQTNQPSTKKFIKMYVSDEEYHDDWCDMKRGNTLNLTATFIGKDGSGIPEIQLDDINY